jgi:hypothetical protein
MLPRYYKLERILGAMRRFHAKIQRIRDGVEAFYPTPPPGGADGTPSVIYIKPNPGDDTNTLTDYVLAFFIFSHSLKDWIINDDDIGGLKKDRIEHVEAFINNNNCLMIAA